MEVSGVMDAVDDVFAGNTNAMLRVGGGMVLSEAVKAQLLTRLPFLGTALVGQVTVEDVVKGVVAYFGSTSDSYVANGFAISMAWSVLFKVLGSFGINVPTFANPFASVNGAPFNLLNSPEARALAARQQAQRQQVRQQQQRSRRAMPNVI